MRPQATNVPILRRIDVGLMPSQPGSLAPTFDDHLVIIPVPALAGECPARAGQADEPEQEQTQQAVTEAKAFKHGVAS